MNVRLFSSKEKLTTDEEIANKKETTDFRLEWETKKDEQLLREIQKTITSAKESLTSLNSFKPHFNNSFEFKGFDALEETLLRQIESFQTRLKSEYMNPNEMSRIQQALIDFKKFVNGNFFINGRYKQSIMMTRFVSIVKEIDKATAPDNQIDDPTIASSASPRIK